MSLHELHIILLWSEKRNRNLTTLSHTLSIFADQNVPFFPLNHLFFFLFFFFSSTETIQRELPLFILLYFFHTRTLKIFHVKPTGNESNLCPKNEVCIPHTSLLFNLWKPESESAFLLITYSLFLAALSQCL